MDAVCHIKDSSSDMARVKHLMATFGLHYQTARLHLLHVSGIKLPLQAPAALLGEGGTWREAEASGLDQLPLPEIPPERRTVVARTAAAAYARGLIGRGEFAEMLAVDRTAPLDHVLDLLGLEPPGT